MVEDQSSLESWSNGEGAIFAKRSRRESWREEMARKTRLRSPSEAETGKGKIDKQRPPVHSQKGPYQEDRFLKIE